MGAFPQAFTSTVSHWQATNRGHGTLWDHGRHDKLPTDEIDYVIVGAGITGASLAYQLSRPGGAAEGKRIVIVDAKDVASGASGRNGGHCAPASWQAFVGLTTPVSQGGAGLDAEEAVAALFNEADTLNLAKELVAKEKLDIDFIALPKLEVLTTEAGAARNRVAYTAFQKAKAASPRFRSRTFEWDFIDDPQEAKRVSRTNNAVAVNRGPAGTLHPHKLATSLMRLALASKTTDVRFYSWTPIQALTRSDGRWTLNCGSKGKLCAREVVLCTNGWTRHLFPDDMRRKSGIAAHITPFRGHAALITPPASYSGPRTLSTSYSVEMGPYLMTTPSSGIVLGIYNDAALVKGLCEYEDIFGCDNDSEVLPKMRLADYCKTSFTGWGAETPGEGIARVWTGIMGASADLVPLVGRVPGQDGLWISAAFHGHGMARILTCTQSLAQTMKTGQWDERLPTCYEITKKRLQRARASDHDPALSQARL